MLQLTVRRYSHYVNHIREHIASWQVAGHESSRVV